MVVIMTKRGGGEGGECGCRSPYWREISELFWAFCCRKKVTTFQYRAMVKRLLAGHHFVIKRENGWTIL